MFGGSSGNGWTPAELGEDMLGCRNTKTLTFCSRPSSNRLKSFTSRSLTGRSLWSVTTTSTTTSRVVDLIIVCSGEAALACTPSSDVWVEDCGAAVCWGAVPCSRDPVDWGVPFAAERRIKKAGRLVKRDRIFI